MYSVIIPSATPANLIACVQALKACEPELTPDRIIVVDDGARASEAFLPPVTWVQGVKPFVFARAINQGIAAAGQNDVILLNDDAQLMTLWGFYALSWLNFDGTAIGVCSAAIQGDVCNPNQHPGKGWQHGLRDEPSRLAFVCVFIPRTTIDRVGLLDERFTGYGFEDFDYCRRCLDAGLRLCVWDGCVVEHGNLPPTFRSQPDWPARLSDASATYYDKWPIGG